MPALLEDPTSPVIYRMAGGEPYPTSANPQIPSSIFPRPVTLRDRVTIATLIPFFSPDAVPPRLLQYLCDNLNKEIDDGNTYPMIDTLPLATFGPYWFGNFGAVMVQGDIGGIEAVNDMERDGADWGKLCLGSFYVKPNYPGRSSHVCNGGFLVTPAARNKGVGKSMGQCYLDWAPQLGYSYSVFNLVYESNTASTRIWDSLGFKRIGRVPGCGLLKSSAEPVDAIIYGRDLKSEEGIVGNEERFDKIRYYLRHQLYPQGADRSEKSRLRSAATHYKLIPAQDGEPEKLMLKDKEVISDPAQQYDIAKQFHLKSSAGVHAGINKTTAVLATKYHWVRIKETVSHVIKNCTECKDSNKGPMVRPEGIRSGRSKTLEGQTGPPEIQQKPMPNQVPVQDQNLDEPRLDSIQANTISNDLDSSTMPATIHRSQLSQNDFKGPHLTGEDFHVVQQSLQMHSDEHLPNNETQLTYEDMAIDPQIMQEIAQLEYDQQQEHDAFVHSGIGPYTDASHLNQAHSHQQANEFAPSQPSIVSHTAHFMTTHPSSIMGHPSQSAADHVMGASGDTDGTGGSGMDDMQQMRHVLQMEYMNTASSADSQGPYKSNGGMNFDGNRQ